MKKVFYAMHVLRDNMIRVLTQNRIIIKYDEVPEFKGFMELHGEIMSELRTIH